MSLRYMIKCVPSLHSNAFTCACRVFTILPLSFLLLTLLVFCDRPFLDSAIVLFDHRPTPPVSPPEPDLALDHRLTPPVSPPEPDHCDIYDGRWVFDDTYPSYDVCKFAERDFQCHRNGRPDRQYQKWRWQPRHCDIPKFNAQDMLARLKGLRVVFVGDSMGRTQWESLSCLLLQAVKNKASVKIVDYPITKQKLHIGARFEDHNVTIDYYRSPFLVVESQEVPGRRPKHVHASLKLERMDMDVAKHMVDADVLLVNTGHWWTPPKTHKRGLFFQAEGELKLQMPIDDAYLKALSTVTSWVNSSINFNRTEVFFRSFEPAHDGLSMATLPFLNVSNKDTDGYHKARIVMNLVGKLGRVATVLNVTHLSALRPDGHVFNWTGLNRVLDCAHWCLPGVPDTWNRLLYASLLSRGRGVWGAKE